MLWSPHEPSVVSVPHGDDTRATHDSSHLRESRHRIGEVLKNLMGVRYVERCAGEGQGVHIADLELDVFHSGRPRLACGDLDHVRNHIDTHHDTRIDDGRKPPRHRARPTANIKKSIACNEV